MDPLLGMALWPVSLLAIAAVVRAARVAPIHFDADDDLTER